MGVNSKTMKAMNIWEVILKVIVAAITGTLTTITTTNCMEHGPFYRRNFSLLFAGERFFATFVA